MGKIMMKGAAKTLKKVMAVKKLQTWRSQLLSGFRWNNSNNNNLQVRKEDDEYYEAGIIDTMVFKILSVVEAIVLLSHLCCFYLRFGCHI